MQIKYVVSSYKDCTSVNNLIKELVKDMKEQCAISKLSIYLKTSLGSIENVFQFENYN